MKLFICILGGIIIASPCFAWEIDPWSGADIALEAVTVGLFLVDWGQTLDITERDGYYEKNAYLGKDPSRGKVNKYFALSCLAHGLVTWALPVKCEIFGFRFNPRRIWQCGYIGYQCSVVHGNIEAGVRVSF